MNEVTTAKLAEDIRVLTSDLGAVAKNTTATLAELRRPVEAKIAAARKALADRRAARAGSADESGAAVQTRAFDSAWIAVAIAVGVGVALGLLLRRRD